MNLHNLKRFTGILFYVISVGYFIAWGTRYQRQLEEIKVSTFTNEAAFAHHAFMVLFPIMIGIFLVLPRFINMIRRPGTWKFDWVKFIAAGLPTLYLTLFPLLYFHPIGVLPGISSLSYYLLGSSMLPHTVSGIVFGYLLLCTP